MSRQTECIDGFLKRAQADQTVYVTDVRRVFDEVGEKAFHVHAHLYEGAVEVFDMSVPKWETEEQRDFVAEYIRAFLYNLISTLGAIRIEIYLDAADEGLRALAEGLREDFQLDLDKTERSGYGKCLNVNERIVKAQKGDSRSGSEISGRSLKTRRLWRSPQEEQFSRNFRQGPRRRFCWASMWAARTSSSPPAWTESLCTVRN